VAMVSIFRTPSAATTTIATKMIFAITPTNVSIAGQTTIASPTYAKSPVAVFTTAAILNG
jgi:hypothetical protein